MSSIFISWKKIMKQFQNFILIIKARNFAAKINDKWANKLKNIFNFL